MSTIVTSRPADPGDLDFLVDCYLRSMHESIAACRGAWNPSGEQEQFEQQLEIGATRVIQADGVDVGFVRVVRRPVVLQLHTICIAPEYQGRGIGTLVTTEVLARGRRAGCSVHLSVLKSNWRAEALYRRLGFAVVEESEHHRHMKHVGETHGAGV